MLRRVIDIGLATGLVLGLGFVGYVSSTEPSISSISRDVDVKKFDSTPNENVFVFDERNSRESCVDAWKWKPFADSRKKDN